MIDGCARCEETEPDVELVAFDLEEGGALCASCARGGGRPLSPDALDLLRRILGGGLNGALARNPGPESHEVEVLGIRVMEHHVERRLRSTALL